MPIDRMTTERLSALVDETQKRSVDDGLGGISHALRIAAAALELADWEPIFDSLNNGGQITVCAICRDYTPGDHGLARSTYLSDSKVAHLPNCEWLLLVQAINSEDAESVLIRSFRASRAAVRSNRSRVIR